MQKAFIAIALALTLSCVASFSAPAAGWVKPPVSVAADTDINFTNNTRSLKLSTVTSLSDLNLLSYKQPSATDDCEKDNTVSCNWNINFKPVTLKDLSAKTNTSYSFKANQYSTFSNGYAVGFGIKNDSSQILQYYLTQTKLDGGSVLPQVQISSNNAATNTMSILASAASGKTAMVFIKYNSTINFTSYTIGGSSKGKDFTFSTANITDLEAIWGEALSSSQAYVSYKEGDALKVAVADFSSGTIIGTATVSGYDKNMQCSPYATDKKLYGVWCINSTKADADGKINATIFTTSANTTLGSLFTLTNVTSEYNLGAFAYSGYLAFFHSNNANASAITVDKQVWDLSTGKTFMNQTNFLTYDSTKEKYNSVRIPAGGYYGLLYTQNATSNRTGIQVGQIMAGSSLTTVFGFLMTIVAGLFLF